MFCKLFAEDSLYALILRLLTPILHVLTSSLRPLKIKTFCRERKWFFRQIENELILAEVKWWK